MEKKEKIEALAADIIKLSRDSILMHLRFLDRALFFLQCVPQEGIGSVRCDGRRFYYDPTGILRAYQKEPEQIVRLYLHSLLHCIFYHSFRYEKMDTDLWDLAADAAVENTVLELAFTGIKLKTDEEAKEALCALKKEAGMITAEKLYRHWKQKGLDKKEREKYSGLFFKDNHVLWKEQERLSISASDWKKISRRVQTDLKTFSRGKQNGESLEKNLAEAVKERYDYDGLLKRFAVMGESIRVNDEEFDYIYYTYGLEYYGNMPLIEPLEYKEERKVREFVIVIDTSASCRGKTVRDFLQKTYAILKCEESFFRKINVHILQCDSTVQSDTKISCEQEFADFLAHGNLKGFGATDFRPAFHYVARLREEGEFENLKGLIYFTDGYGVYPEQMPDYDVIFAFLEEDENRQSPPSWAIQTVITETEMEGIKTEVAEEKEDEH